MELVALSQSAGAARVSPIATESQPFVNEDEPPFQPLYERSEQQKSQNAIIGSV
jgi:hypothetical protein